ncbi:MAG: hypothetical protein DRI65_13240 [Chloroflexota bacterium]|nr:MAG: hypothetical protein DRI65_13240 [Chloroflexota bacterium]
MDKQEQERYVLNVVGAELVDAINGTYSDEINKNQENALDYYLGNLPGSAEEGRSQVISTDVADAIELLLPMIVKQMVSRGPIISFNAIHEQDEEQAELETQYVHDVFMSDNTGFLNIYTFVKDALMQKNGIMKVYFDDTPEITNEEYSGINELQAQQLLSDPEVELLGSTVVGQIPGPQGMIKLVDIELERTCNKGKVVIETIAPENFRVNSDHNSLDLQEARFTAHVSLQTRSELLEQGYDEEIVSQAAAGSSDTFQRKYRFYAQGEEITGEYGTASEDSSQDLIEVSECCMRLDIDEDGIAELVRVVVLGNESAYAILDIEEIEENPFVSSSCIIMPHKFMGLSIYDRLKMIQDQKTSLWRNILDNLYLQNNREKEVVDGKVNLDDLLVSRPGGIKRVSEPGMIRELAVQPIGQEAQQMLTYLDQVKVARVGVSPDTAGNPLPVGNDTAHGIERMMSAKEEMTGLMIRAVAETGLKAAYIMIRNLLVRHKDTQESYKFQGKWAMVNPSDWGPRSKTTVNVGSGTGDEIRKQSAITQVLAYQAQALQLPEQVMVGPAQVFNAMDTFCKVSGLTTADEYFLNPDTDEGKQKQEGMDKQAAEAKHKEDEAKQTMLQAQNIMAQAELLSSKAEIEANQVKLQNEQDKLKSESAITALKTEVDVLKGVNDGLQSKAELEFKYAELDVKEKLEVEKINSNQAIKLTELEMTAQKELNAELKDNLEVE